MLLLLAFALPASARPQALVVIADHLTLADVTRADLPGLTQMRRNGQLALMSPGLPQGADPIANVYAALGAGDSIRVGDVSQGRMASALRQAGLRTTLIGNADGDDTGTDRPAFSFFPSPDVVTADDGTVSDATAPGGRQIDPAHLWAQTQTALQDSDLVVVHFGDFERLERENQRGDFAPAAYQAHRERALRALSDYLGLACGGQRAGGSRPRWLFLVTPTSLLDSRGHWNRLTPYLQWPPQAGRKVSLFALSDTTQTVGLVAARDFAPTLLNALGVTPPIQMTGDIIQPVPSASEEAALSAVPRLDTMTRLNQEVQNPLFWGLGFLAAATLGIGLALYLSGVIARDGRARKICCYGLRLLSAWPLALLIAPLFLPASVGAYLGVIGALTAFIALLPSPAVIFSLTALVLVIDGLTGTTLVSQSVLSAYALSGIRFYGIGNEYMGVLLGGTLLAASLMKPRGPLPVLLLFALVIFVLSFPEFGAKAGGAITATATFTVAWLRLRGRAVTWKHLLGSLLAGFALVFVWAVVGHWLGSRRTHIDSAVDAVFEGRFGYIAGVAWRKVGLAVRVLLHPGTLLGLVALLGVGAALRAFLARQVRDYLTRHPRFAAVWGAGLWGCLVALFVNDSGVVAAILLLTCLLPALLHGLYKECESLPLMSETSASALPSATP
ncbi:MAG: hypothetical protein M3Y28_07580 [Armatimonadota bacterium]|nr:hypothetical protein [Armatimonadota bacterium]